MFRHLVGTSPSPMGTPLPAQHIHLLPFPSLFWLLPYQEQLYPFMAPQRMWEMEFYQLRPHKPSSSMSAEHTNLVARPFIPLSSTSELHRAVLDVRKDTSQTQLHSCSVPTPLSQSDFAEIRGVTSDDSRLAQVGGKEKKIPACRSQQGGSCDSDTGLDVQLVQICAAPLTPAELKKNLPQKITQRINPMSF